VRVFCEDGRDFIRSVARRSFENPFAPFNGVIMSRSKEDVERRKLKKLGSQTEARTISVRSVPETVSRKRISVFVMNLPDSAIQFLDAFRGILASDDLRQVYDVMPMVHCYCFTRELEPSKAEADIRHVCALQSCLTGTEVPLPEGGSEVRVCVNR